MTEPSDDMPVALLRELLNASNVVTPEEVTHRQARYPRKSLEIEQFPAAIRPSAEIAFASAIRKPAGVSRGVMPEGVHLNGRTNIPSVARTSTMG
jgi:hypothetical protein